MEAERKCKCCNWVKKESEFYKGKGMCKDCYIKRQTEYNNNKRENRLEYMREYMKSNAGRKSLKESKAKLKREWIYCEVYRAVRDGKLSRGTCEVCGSSEVQAHHDDYTQPLNVRWLCRIHHSELHAKLRRVA